MCNFLILYYFIGSSVLLTRIQCVTPTPRIRGSEAGLMTGMPNHNEYLDVTGIIGNVARTNSVYLMRKHLYKNYLQFGHSLSSVFPSQY
jgi:hypothetical protein